MASVIKVRGRWRAQVRRHGVSRCMTFDTKSQAAAWAATVESEVSQLKATGFMQTKGLTLGEGLIDRYEREAYPIKPWGRSKSADLKKLKTELGDEAVAALTHERILESFMTMHKAGAGGVTLSQRIGYLITVLSTAKSVWRLTVPLEAAKSARDALKQLGLIKKGKARTRRVSDTEIARIIAHIERKATRIPIAAILWFSVATSMRISETCRIRWQDLNSISRTIIIKDRKHPSEKEGNHQEVPLLTVTGHDSFAIINAQPKRGMRVFPFNERTISAYFTEAVAQLAIDNLHLHDLRHEAISRLFEAGYRIEQVSVVSGHRDWSMLKRYTHLRAVDLHRADLNR